MDFKFNFPSNIKKITIKDSILFIIEEYGFIFSIKQNPDFIQNQDNIENYLAYLNMIYSEIFKLLHDKINVQFKCLNMFKKFLNGFRAGYMKGTIVVSKDKNEEFKIFMSAIIISPDENDKCIVNAIFPCDSNAELNEKCFMDIIESVQTEEDKGEEYK